MQKVQSEEDARWLQQEEENLVRELQLLSSNGITADDITAFNYLLLFCLTKLLIFSYKCYSRDYCIKCFVKSLVRLQA